MKTKEELKQEFIRKWRYHATLGYGNATIDLEDQLNKDLDCLLADLEQSKWKKYPENVPDEDKKVYLVTRIVSDKQNEDVTTNYLNMEMLRYYKNYPTFKIANVIAFRELPEPYKSK